MRVPQLLAVGLFLALALSGCAKGRAHVAPDEPKNEAAAGDYPRFFWASPSGLERIDAIDGVTELYPGVDVNVFTGSARNVLRMVLVHFDTGGLVKLSSSDRLTATEGGEGPGNLEGVCGIIIHAHEAWAERVREPLDGEFFLKRALGQDVASKQTPGFFPRAGWGYGGSIASSSAPTEHDIKAGSWMLIAGGYSGSGNATGEIRARIETDANLTLYDLAPTEVRCGNGFRDLEGGQSPARGVQIGGSRNLTAAYGHSFRFNPGCTSHMDPPNPRNSAKFSRPDGDLPLNSGTAVAETAWKQGTLRLAVDEWVGSPFWMMIGVAASTGRPQLPCFP